MPFHTLVILALAMLSHTLVILAQAGIQWCVWKILDSCLRRNDATFFSVTLAQAGIHWHKELRDSRLRGNDCLGTKETPEP